MKNFNIIMIIFTVVISCNKPNLGYKHGFSHCYIRYTKYDIHNDLVCFDFYKSCRQRLCAKIYKSGNEYQFYSIDTNKVYFTDDTSRFIPVSDSLRKYFMNKQLPDTRYPTDEHPAAFLKFIVDKEGNTIYKGGTVNFPHFSEDGMIQILNSINLKFEPFKINDFPVYSEMNVVVNLDNIKWKRWRANR